MVYYASDTEIPKQLILVTADGAPRGHGFE